MRFRAPTWIVLSALTLGISVSGCSSADEATSEGEGEVEAESAPPTLSFEELVTLSTLDGHRDGTRYVLEGAPPGLEDKVNTLLSTPRISNKWFAKGARRYLPAQEGLGPSVRVVEWNIERGEQLPNILAMFRAANDPAERQAFLNGTVKAEIQNDPEQRTIIDGQLDAISQADVIILNEVDNGMARSGYEDVVVRLADTLQMNYAFATEFIEVDPLVLGTQEFAPEDFQTIDATTKKPVAAGVDGYVAPEELAQTAAEVNQMVKKVDPAQMKGLHGVAILSRYKILKDSVKAHPLEVVCHDWNSGEKKPLDLAAKGFDFLAEKVFLEKIGREIRHAGRSVLSLDLEVPGLDQGPTPNRLTVVTAHIEDKATAQCRAGQMRETLHQVSGRQNPTVLAGDFNTLGIDGRPKTIERLLFGRFTDLKWITKQLTTRLIPYVGWAWTVTDTFNWIRLQHDPTGIHIPIFLPNPERELFDNVENFNGFADGARFDFRGDTSRTTNSTRKTLANSNERAGKGFKPTDSLSRTFGPIGTSKIDWIFVRGYAKKSRSDKESYRMAPHFPRTLSELQYATETRMSDHAPITVNLPLTDPCIGKSSAACSGNDEIPDQEPDFADDATWTDQNAEPPAAQ